MPKKAAPLAAIRKKWGARARLDSPGFLEDLIQLILSHGKIGSFYLRLPTGHSLPWKATAAAEAERIGLFKLSASMQYGFEQAEGSLYTYLISLFTETRKDELVTVVYYTNDRYIILPARVIDEFLSVARWGWLTEAAESDDVSYSPVCLLDKEEASRSDVRAIAKRLLRPMARRSRSLLREEIRQIERLYSDLSDESLEPIRRMQMRVSTGYGRIDGPTDDVRRLKGRVSAEERRFLEEKQLFREEMNKRIEEAKAKYRSYFEIQMVQAAIIHFDLPVIKLPGIGTLKYNPLTEMPWFFVDEKDGAIVDISDRTQLHNCGEGHIIDRSANPVCSCGTPVCLRCFSENQASCFYCGNYICRGCMVKVFNPIEQSFISICPECNMLGYNDTAAFIDLL